MQQLTRQQIMDRDDVSAQSKALIDVVQERMAEFNAAWISGESPDVLRVLASLIALHADELASEVSPAPLFLSRVAS